MSEQSDGKSGNVFSIPTSGQEFSALALSLLAVFAIVQFGAPLIRQLDFLDQKIRDVFIGGAFAAFPPIHRGAKRMVAGFKAAPPARPDLSPWFVSGAFVAMLIFAWNQLVSFAGAMAIDTFAALAGVSEKADVATVSQAMVSSLVVLSVPLTAIVSIFAGILLFRNTRSHVSLALGFAALLYIASNAAVSWAVSPAFVQQQWAQAVSQGTMGVVYFTVGLGLVAAVVFVFGGVGVLISYFSSEGSLGKVIAAARRLSPAEREGLALDITNRVEAALKAKTKAS